MSAALQWAIVAVIVVVAAVYLVKHLRRSRCSGCDSTTCPIRRRNRR